jgi:hypothetical protein
MIFYVIVCLKFRCYNQNIKLINGKNAGYNHVCDILFLQVLKNTCKFWEGKNENHLGRNQNSGISVDVFRQRGRKGI